MAVDTAHKRYSLIHHLPLPDGTLDAPDRLVFLWLYSGIAADTPTTPAVETPLDLVKQLETDWSVFIPGDGTGFDIAVTGPDGEIRGVFEDESYAGGRDGPWLWIKDTDMGTIDHGSTLSIKPTTSDAAKDYTVAARRPDGNGFTQLLLEQQPVGGP